jgi:hypothetical protein
VITSGADEVVSVSMFDDEDSAVRSNQLAAEFVRDRLQQFQLNLTVAMSGPVRVSRAAAAVNGPVQAPAAAPAAGQPRPGPDAG